MLNFKKAIKEILIVEMGAGLLLDGICDGVLASSVFPLPDSYNNFITLGDYKASDVRIGEMQQKFRLVELDVDCCSVVRQGKLLSEETAEEAAYKLASVFRTILMQKKTLISTSYPSGLAKTSEALDEFFQYLIYDKVVVAVNTITYFMKIVEG